MWSMNLLFVTEYYCIVLDGLFGTASVGCRTNGVKECWRKGYKVLDRGALWAVKLKQMIGVLYSRRSNKIQSREKKPINAGFWIYWTRFSDVNIKRIQQTYVFKRDGYCRYWPPVSGWVVWLAEAGFLIPDWTLTI